MLHAKNREARNIQSNELIYRSSNEMFLSWPAHVRMDAKVFNAQKKFPMTNAKRENQNLHAHLGR